MSQKYQSSKGRGRYYALCKTLFYFTVAGRSIQSQKFLRFLFLQNHLKVDIVSTRKELSPKQCKIFKNNILSTCLHK